MPTLPHSIFRLSIATIEVYFMFMTGSCRPTHRCRISISMMIAHTMGRFCRYAGGFLRQIKALPRESRFPFRRSPPRRRHFCRHKMPAGRYRTASAGIAIDYCGRQHEVKCACLLRAPRSKAVTSAHFRWFSCLFKVIEIIRHHHCSMAFIGHRRYMYRCRHAARHGLADVYLHGDVKFCR